MPWALHKYQNFCYYNLQENSEDIYICNAFFITFIKLIMIRFSNIKFPNFHLQDYTIFLFHLHYENSFNIYHNKVLQPSLITKCEMQSSYFGILHCSNMYSLVVSYKHFEHVSTFRAPRTRLYDVKTQIIIINILDEHATSIFSVTPSRICDVTTKINTIWTLTSIKTSHIIWYSSNYNYMTPV